MGFSRNMLHKIQQILPKDWNVSRALNKYIPYEIRSNVRKFLVEPPEYIQALDTIGRELNSFAMPPQPEKPIRVLYGPSFSIYPPCFIHDRVLSYALRLRGAEVIPIYCDAIQSVECEFFGGVWGGDDFEENCNKCVIKSQTLWQSNPIPAIRLSNYVQDEEIEAIANKVSHLDSEQWSCYEEDGLPFGLWAKDKLVNNYVVGDYHLIPNYHSLGLVYLKNFLLLKVTYERIIDDIKPDRAVTHDSYYGMWAILQKLCERRGIPFYSHYIGQRQNAWCYAYKQPAMSLDFSKSWKNFSQIPLDERKLSTVKKWLHRHKEGKDSIFKKSPLQKDELNNFDLTKIDPDKPLALLATNVIWDLCALNKQIIFKDMIDWIANTIEWFSENPQFQLIIRTHPSEAKPLVPPTKETVEYGLYRTEVQIPSNVFLLSPKVPLTIYELFPLTEVGLVHTSGVGYEMAAFGLPVITSAKAPYHGFGFTLDPCTRKEYFDVLEKTLLGDKIIDVETQIDLAQKFILFHHHHYYTKIDILDYTWGEAPKLKVHSIEDLLPGKNKFRDYILDSIIDGLPILSEDRWPPES